MGLPVGNEWTYYIYQVIELESVTVVESKYKGCGATLRQLWWLPMVVEVMGEQVVARKMAGDRWKSRQKIRSSRETHSTS